LAGIKASKIFGGFAMKSHAMKGHAMKRLGMKMEIPPSIVMAFSTLKVFLACIALAIGLVVFSLAVFSHTAAAAQALPELSPEGLRLVPNTKAAAVYKRDGADFSGYDKVAILDCSVGFRKNWKRDQNRASPFNVDDSDITRIKTELASEFKKIFIKELTAKGTQVVSEAGTGVLILRPAIFNLDITAPDTMEAGRTRNFSASAGQMTLFLEIYDSVTGDLLARVLDPQESSDYGFIRVRNSVTNRADADRILKQWATTLGSYLERARGGVAAQ
jgi:hypothetical protein